MTPRRFASRWGPWTSRRGAVLTGALGTRGPARDGTTSWPGAAGRDDPGRGIPSRVGRRATTWATAPRSVIYNDGTLVAPLGFPVPVVNIRRITLYALDESADNDACLYVFRGDPAAGGTLRLGEVCTSGADPTDPQAWSTTDIGPRRVNTAARGAYLSLTLKPDIKVYGVKINYTYETAG